MGGNSLPKTVTRQRRGCDLKQRPSALESSMLTTRLPSHPSLEQYNTQYPWSGFLSGDHLGEPVPEETFTHSHPWGKKKEDSQRQQGLL